MWNIGGVIIDRVRSNRRRRNLCQMWTALLANPGMCHEKLMTDRLNCVTVVQVSSGGGFIYMCLQVPLPLTIGDAVGCESWGIRHGVHEVFGTLGFCAASVDSFVTGISRKRVGLIKVSEDILTLDDVTATASRNVGNELTIDTMQCPRGAKIFSYQWMEFRGCWDSLCGRAEYKIARLHWTQSNACCSIRSQPHSTRMAMVVLMLYTEYQRIYHLHVTRHIL